MRKMGELAAQVKELMAKPFDHLERLEKIVKKIEQDKVRTEF